MKKILSRFFSVAIIAATVACPSMAQYAKKAVAPKANAQKEVTALAKQLPQKAVKVGTKANLNLAKFRTNNAPDGFAMKRSSVKPLKKAGNAPKEISKVVEGMPTIYGSVVYADNMESEDIGLYQIPQDESPLSLVFLGPDSSCGGVVKDGLYYSSNYFEFWGMIFITSTAYELESGDLVKSWSPTDFQVLCMGGYTTDPTTGNIYGIGFTEDASSLQLAKIEVSEEDGVSATGIAPLDGYWSCCAFDSTGQLYAIQAETGNTKLYKIDKSTAETTLVGEIGLDATYVAGCVIDTKTNRMFWDVCGSDETSKMYEVNLATGEATFLYEVDGSAEITGMFIPEPIAEENAPDYCQNVEVVFNGGSLQGTVNLTAPANYFDGSAAAGNVTIHVLANGEEVATKSAAVGAQTTVDVNLTSTGAGKYNFRVYASNANGDGPKTDVKNVWVGADTPEAPAASLEYVNGNMEITWTPVTATVNGGWLDADNLSYTVEDAEGNVLAEGLTVCSYSVAVEESDDLVQYYYCVYAKAGDLVSAKGRTNTVTLGSIEPPYTSDFAAEGGLSGWTIIDANEDGKTWQVYGDNEVRVQYNSSLDMDDWLITPPLKLEAGKIYMLNFTAHANGSSFPERLEVMFGDNATPAALTEELVEPTVLNSATPTEFVCKLAPETDGTYYVGFHGISDADQFYLYVGNITIEAGISTQAPDVATDMKVTPDINGDLKAEVSFKTPAKNIDGEAITTLTKVDLYRGNELIKTFDAPACGTQLAYTDEVEDGGVIQYAVVAYNEYGMGLKTTASAFIGFEKPLAPETVNVSRTSIDGQVILDWTAVTEDIDGNTIPADKVTYTVADADGNTVASGLTTTFYTYQAVPAGEQDFVQYTVYAVTTGGENGTLSDMIPCGTPYTSINESFADGTLSYIWGILSVGQGTIQLFKDDYFDDLTSSDGDNGFIAVNAQYLDQGAGLFSGLVTVPTSLENPGLSFYTYNIVGENPDINEITVSILDVNGDGEWEEVYGPKTVVDIVGEGVDGWGKVTVSLGAYVGKTIQFMITAVTKQYIYTMLDNIQIGSILAHDLVANGIQAPEQVKVGEDYEVSVAVSNNGGQVAENFTVELYADDVLAETKTVESLDAGASTSVIFERTMSGAAKDPVEYYAKVVYALDLDNENNATSTVSVAPVQSNFAAPKNLKAENDNKNVKLTWEEPNLEFDAPITWDFEDGDAFAAEYGDWTFVDGDEATVGGFQDMDVPGITPGSTTGSFWIWDQSQLGNQTFEAHSGTKYLFALFRYDDGTTDDWAISPEVSDKGQTISFYAKSYSSQFAEQIRVLYTTSNSVNPDDYVEVMAKVTVPGDWTLYEVALPAGAKRFAINSCATGSFMLMIDDVSYVPAGGGSESGTLELLGYNVYRDGVKINDALVEETEYVDSNVVEGQEYTYVVTAVYSVYGESATSNEATIKASGVEAIVAGGVAVTVEGSNIVVLNAESLNVTVSNVNGALIFNGKGEAKTVVPADKGVYVVKADKLVKKVMVK